MLRPTLRRTTLFVATVAIGAAAAGFTSQQATAAIGSAKAKFEVIDRPCQVVVEGRVSMSQREAQGLIDSGHRVLVRIWGEDPISDDLRLTSYLGALAPNAFAAGHIVATPAGLRFRLQKRVQAEVLNEDDNMGPGAVAQGDELYAGVRLIDSDRRTIRQTESNRVYGDYGFFIGCTTYDVTGGR